MRTFEINAILFVLALVLTNCALHEQIVATRDAADDQTCLSFGAAPGTDAYVQCRMQQQQLRQQRLQEAADAISHHIPAPAAAIPDVGLQVYRYYQYGSNAL